MSNPIFDRNLQGRTLVLPEGLDTFPFCLYRLLEKAAEDERIASVVSWLPNGKGFLVYDHRAFVNEIIPAYFNQSKYQSFQRQLNLYQFRRILSGPFKGKCQYN